MAEVGRARASIETTAGRTYASGPRAVVRTARSLSPDSVGGAYSRRGDEKNPQLTRIPGTTSATQTTSTPTSSGCERPATRPPQLGADADLFSFPRGIGSARVFHPRGGLVRTIVKDYSRQRHVEGDYTFVNPAHITERNRSTRAAPAVVRRRHVPADRPQRRRRVLPQPMNCPFHVLDLQVAPPYVPRAAAATVRVRGGISLREVGRRPRSRAVRGMTRTTRTSSPRASG